MVRDSPGLHGRVYILYECKTFKTQKWDNFAPSALNLILKKVVLENVLFQTGLIFSISTLYVGIARNAIPFFIGLLFELDF